MLQFGGVGDSGTGAYRGKASFDCFVHRRSVTTTPNWMESLLNVRYPPYEGKFEQYAKTSMLKPNFDRNGKVNFSILTYVLTLGSGSKSGAAMRLTLLGAVAVALKVLMERGSIGRA
jgi:beta-apo-4'-carotenal oxygenase